MVVIQVSYPVYGIVTDGGVSQSSASVYVKDSGTAVIKKALTDAAGKYNIDLFNYATDGNTITVWVFKAGKYKAGTPFTLNTANMAKRMDLALATTTFAETITISDAVTKTVTKTVSDTISISDAKTMLVNKTLSDTVTITDAKTIQFNKALADTITISDGLAKIFTKTFTDTVTITDTMSWSILVFPFPVYGLITDTGVGCDTANVYIQDIVGGSILFINTDDVGYYITDIQDIVIDGHTYKVWAFATNGKYGTDTFMLDLDLPSQEMNLAVTNYPLADTLTITDSCTKVFGKLLSDTITITDSHTKIFNKILSETLTMSDGLSHAASYIRTVGDTIILSDAYTKVFYKILPDTLAISDGIIKTPYKVISETLTISDAYVKLFGKHISEIITLSDSLTNVLTSLIAPSMLKGYPYNEETFKWKSTNEEPLLCYSKNEQKYIIKKDED